MNHAERGTGAGPAESMFDGAAREAAAWLSRTGFRFVRDESLCTDYGGLVDVFAADGPSDAWLVLLKVDKARDGDAVVEVYDNVSSGPEFRIETARGLTAVTVEGLGQRAGLRASDPFAKLCAAFDRLARTSTSDTFDVVPVERTNGIED
jgi:hypothetical protein